MLRSPTTSDDNDEGPGKLLFAMPQHSNHAFLTKKLAFLDNESTSTVQSNSQHWNAVLNQPSIPVTMQPMVTTTTREQQQQAVDYLSLSDALEGESADDDMSGDIADSTDSLLGRDIELALSDNEQDDDDGVGSDTLFQLLGGRKDLEQRMNAIEEAQEQCSTSRDEQQFNIPTVLRVMYMGACSEKDKRILFRKLSRALSTLFHDCPSFFIRNPHIFKERKHHLLLMSLLPDEENGEENIVETCEDNGLSIIEADFSWSTVSAEKDMLNHMITRYLCIQCEYAIQQDPWASTTSSHQQNENFDGFLYPDRTPNGIDLCIYFYDGSSGTKDEDDRVKEDLIILWQLKKLGIPIIPILSSPPSAMRRTSIRSPTSPIFNTRSVADRRTRLADMLANYKIRCIDIALSSLDIGQPPSFQTRNTVHTTTTAHSNLENRLGRDWAISSVTAPAPYNILTVEQFAALDPQALFSILKQCRQKALRKEKLLQQIHHSHDPAAAHPSSTATTQPSPPSTSPVYTVSRKEPTPVSSSIQSTPRHNLFGLMVVILCMALCISWCYSSTQRGSEVWTASLSIANNASSFVIEVRGSSNVDPHKVYEIAIPVSSACLESSTPVPLGDIQFMHPPRIDLVQQQSHCQPNHPPSSSPLPSSQRSSHHSTHAQHEHASHWDQLRRTATYFFGSPTKIIKTVFNREQH